MSLVSAGASELVNPADSTFHTRRGSQSILAYIRRASALPPSPPSASPHVEWGRALHSSSASASQDPLSSHSRRRLSPDRRWAGGSRGVSLLHRSARIGARSASPARISSHSRHLPSTASVRSPRARGPESSARSAGGGTAGAAVVAALRLPAFPEWGQSTRRRETSVARRRGRGTFKLLLGGSSPPPLAPALGESGVWRSGCCYFSGLPGGGRIQPPARRGSLLFARLLVAFPFPAHLCRR